MAEAKKRILTYAGLRALEEELENLKVVKLIDKDYVAVVDNVIRYQPDKLALDIYGYLLETGDK